MKLPPSKLAAARLAAAEVFIAAGLDGTDWQDADTLRQITERFWCRVRYTAGTGSIDILVGMYGDEVKVRIATGQLGTLSIEETAAAAQVLHRVIGIARKVEAAIEEAAKS